MTTVRSEADLQRNLAEITRLLEKHRALESLTHRQEGPRRDLPENLQHRQNEAELRRRLRMMHAADLAYILEALPLDYRRTVWQQVSPELAGIAFVEVSAAVRDSLVAVTQRQELIALLSTLDPEDLGCVVAHGTDRTRISFGPHDDARDAVKTFERYDLISAPVVDNRGKLVGRLTVDAVMDLLRDESNLQALKNAGLSGDEDLFAAPWNSARNRWPWLAVNLLTAFIASRVIGQFEGTIERVAALAALMPIVASIGGNTGNQTMALVIRALALDHLQLGNARRLLQKELAIGVMNGTVWGLVVGIFAIGLYTNIALGMVMSGAVVLNLLVAALAGVTIPLGLQAAGRDPAQGSSVLLTFITDAMGFFLFLGLATLFIL